MSVTFLIPLRVVFELDGLRKDAAQGESAIAALLAAHLTRLYRDKCLLGTPKVSAAPTITGGGQVLGRQLSNSQVLQSEHMNIWAITWSSRNSFVFICNKSSY